MAAAVRTSFSAAGTEAGGTTYDSASIALQSGDTVYVFVCSSDGSPAAPTGVVWDPGGVAEALTSVASQACGTFGQSTLWRGQSLTAKTAAFRATWSASQGEQIIGGIVCTGVDTTTPNGTIATGTANNTTAVSATATTTSGQLVLGFGHYVDTSPSTYLFNSPSGTELWEVTTSPQGYDRIAGQHQTAAGTSTAATWTLSGSDSAMDWRAFAVPLNDAASGTTITPGAGSVVLTGSAPTRLNTSDDRTITPGAGSVVLTGSAPTQTLTLQPPGAGSLVLTGFAPTLSIGKSITPGSGSVVLTGAAPTLDLGIVPGAGSVVLTGSQPTVQNAGDTSITPGAGSVVLAGSAPTVSATAHQTVTPGAGSVVLTGSAPTVTEAGSFSVTPAAGGIVLTGFAPELTLTGTGGVIPAGRGSKRRRRKPVTVEVDGQLFTVSSEEEAVELLETARTVAAQKAAEEAQTVVQKRKTASRRSHKPLRLDPVELAAPTVKSADTDYAAELQRALDEVYAQAALDAELALHMHHAQVLDEEDALLLLLLTHDS